jgi:histone deacetylase 11
MANDSDAPNSWPNPRIVYHRRYNIGLFGLERLHPFDSRKYGRAWKVVRGRFGKNLSKHWVKPPRPANRAELLTVHTEAYLKRLREPQFIAGVLEISLLRRVPGWITDRLVLRPMRWATMGTIIAARQAIEHGLAINLSGGYHHASPNNGHGFSAYADVAIAIHDLRSTRRLSEDDRIVYIDLDAHQGNGVCRCFLHDKSLFIYDQFNRSIFPSDVLAQRRIDCSVPVSFPCHESDYLAALRSNLPKFLDALTQRDPFRLAIYNAGTDIFEADLLGGMSVSAKGVLERDQFVLQELIRRRIPTLVVLSGGYSRESFQLVADMVGYVLETWGTATKT